MAVLIIQSCVKVKHCILSSHPPTCSHVKHIYLAGGKAFFSSVCCGARGAWGGGGWGSGGVGNVCLCSPGSFLYVGVHSFEEHLGNAFKQMEVLTGVFPSKISAICFRSLLF